MDEFIQAKLAPTIQNALKIKKNQEGLDGNLANFAPAQIKNYQALQNILKGSVCHNTKC